jgi:hypothetical protein
VKRLIIPKKRNAMAHVNPIISKLNNKIGKGRGERVCLLGCRDPYLVDLIINIDLDWVRNAIR